MSWENCDFSLYFCFDFVYNGKGLVKFLENNVDMFISLYEFGFW